MSVKINMFELENVKRIKALKVELKPGGMTTLGGKNNAGKTSALDAIAWTLGGDKFRPSNPNNTETGEDAHTKVVLNNGLVVERFGKNGTLRVTDPDGLKGSQTLLNNFISTFALNLPEFMKSTPAKKAEVLLQVIGVGDELTKLEAREKQMYEARADAKKDYDREKILLGTMPFHSEVPGIIMDTGDLLEKLNAANARNKWINDVEKHLDEAKEDVKNIKDQITKLQIEQGKRESDLNRLVKELEGITPTDTMAIQAAITENDSLRAKARENQARNTKKSEVNAWEKMVKERTEALEKVRSAKLLLLESANLPLPGLTVENGELIYNGQAWDCMSGSEQLKVATSIGKQIAPGCGFVLVDKAEQFDVDQLREFSAWAEKEDLQIIATRVSTTDECSLIIEDGMIKE